MPDLKKINNEIVKVTQLQIFILHNHTKNPVIVKLKAEALTETRLSRNSIYSQIQHESKCRYYYKSSWRRVEINDTEENHNSAHGIEPV